MDVVYVFEWACIFMRSMRQCPLPDWKLDCVLAVGDGYRGVKNSRLSKKFEYLLISCQNMCLGTRNSNFWKKSIFECPPGLFMDSGDKCCQNRGFWSVKIQLFQILTYDLSLEA